MAASEPFDLKVLQLDFFKTPSGIDEFVSNVAERQNKDLCHYIESHAGSEKLTFTVSLTLLYFRTPTSQGANILNVFPVLSQIIPAHLSPFERRFWTFLPLGLLSLPTQWMPPGPVTR